MSSYMPGLRGGAEKVRDREEKRDSFLSLGREAAHLYEKELEEKGKRKQQRLCGVGERVNFAAIKQTSLSRKYRTGEETADKKCVSDFLGSARAHWMPQL